MDKELKDVRSRIKDISDVEMFNLLLNSTMLSPEERNLLTLLYKDGKQITFIADELGMSYESAKRLHKKCLKKISKTINKIMSL